ncbi:V-type proton ATPase subunit E [Ceratocystis platani]|uniref:V-type proton ATPase subunit E n=1 Tax=Ceratocystis fimbriata f. sp. platani TaxID=88771 RepID=A0A0F8DFP9_CERFI|nr:V-type proton ATPase subunit E [Ceratocystis platani]
MSAIHGLSDDQVGQELRKMTAFIKQEAEEKAREITIKADEEFNIEKAKLVRSETDAIDTAYEKKYKQATMAQQITRSTVANKARLTVLSARETLLDEIFDEAEAALKKSVVDDKSRYEASLTKLVLEGAYALDEPEMLVRLRPSDKSIADATLKSAADEFKKATGREVKLTVDAENPLAEDSAGGAIVVGGKGKITIDNTLEARLSILRENALPAVRQSLFGSNPNRKFYD